LRGRGRDALQALRRGPGRGDQPQDGPQVHRADRGQEVRAVLLRGALLRLGPGAPRPAGHRRAEHDRPPAPEPLQRPPPQPGGARAFAAYEVGDATDIATGIATNANDVVGAVGGAASDLIANDLASLSNFVTEATNPGPPQTLDAVQPSGNFGSLWDVGMDTV